MRVREGSLWTVAVVSLGLSLRALEAVAGRRRVAWLVQLAQRVLS